MVGVLMIVGLHRAPVWSSSSAAATYLFKPQISWYFKKKIIIYPRCENSGFRTLSVLTHLQTSMSVPPAMGHCAHRSASTLWAATGVSATKATPEGRMAGRAPREIKVRAAGVKGLGSKGLLHTRLRLAVRKHCCMCAWWSIGTICPKSLRTAQSSRDGVFFHWKQFVTKKGWE